MYKKLDIILTLIKEEREERKQFDEAMSEKLAKAIDEKAASSGQITASVLEDLLKRRENEFAQRVDIILRQHFETISSTRPSQPLPTNPTSQQLLTRDGYPVYAYASKLDWDVPQEWVVPTDCSLKTAFNLWFNGLKGDDGVHTVRPYKLLTRLPKKEKKRFQTEWVPILRLMSSYPELNHEKCSSQEHILEEFDKCIVYVLGRVSYIKESKKHLCWTVSTWSKRISNSSIMKNGKEEDKVGLVPIKQHARKRTFATSNSKSAKQARVAQGLLTMGL